MYGTIAQRRLIARCEGLKGMERQRLRAALSEIHPESEDDGLERLALAEAYTYGAGQDEVYPAHPVEKNFLAYSPSSDGSSYYSDDSNYDAHGNFIFRLMYPIYGTIASRRAISRSEDFKCMKRQQRFQADFDSRLRHDEVVMPGELFRAIDWNPTGLVVRRDDVSPGTVLPMPLAPYEALAAYEPPSALDDLNWAEEWEAVERQVVRERRAPPASAMFDTWLDGLLNESPVSQYLNRSFSPTLGMTVTMPEKGFSPTLGNAWDGQFGDDPTFGGMVEYL